MNSLRIRRFENLKKIENEIIPLPIIRLSYNLTSYHSDRITEFTDGISRFTEYTTAKESASYVEFTQRTNAGSNW